MATKKELFEAVQLLRNECMNRDSNKDCGSNRCPIWKWCDKLTEECGGGASPCFWPDPEEVNSERDVILAENVSELVRCKNCYAYKKDSESAIAAGLNPDMYCPNLRVEMPPDGFCFYGAIAPANHTR